MNTEKPNVGLVILITAVIVGGGVYYFTTGAKNLDTNNAVQTTSTPNQTSKEYAVMGRQLWSAFQCASWASVTGDSEEQERLFLFGYAQGKTFLEALNSEKIQRDDISENVPIVVTMLLQGPTEEFILGRLFENAQDSALKDVFQTGNEYNSESLREIIAGNKYRESNCQLIGE